MALAVLRLDHGPGFVTMSNAEAAPGSSQIQMMPTYGFVGGGLILCGLCLQPYAILLAVHAAKSGK